MATQDIQQLRKDLKIWESAFYIVHQRKPDKQDFADAPKEIKEKYQTYSHKRAASQETVTKEISHTQDLVETQLDNGVWGVEFNKTPDTNELKASKSSNPKASLDKLGAKLFNTFAKTQSPLFGKSRGVFKKQIDPEGQAADSKSTEQAGGSISRVFGKSEKRSTDSNNAVDRSDSSSSGKFSESSKPEDCLETPDDFVVKGELFKGAEKVYLSRASAPKSFSHTVQRPRLSFLSANMPVSFRDGNSSNDEFGQIRVAETPGDRSDRDDVNFEDCSDILCERGRKEILLKVGKLTQDNIVSVASEKKERIGTQNNCITSQNVFDESQNDNSFDVYERYDKNKEIPSGDSNKNVGYSKHSSAVSTQIVQPRKKILKPTGRKYSAANPSSSDNSLPITPSVLTSFIKPADIDANNDTIPQQNSSSENNIQDSKSETSVASSMLGAKARPKRCSTAKSESSRSTSRSGEGGKKAVMVDKPEACSVLPKKAEQGTRKRTLDVPEGWSEDIVDDSKISEKNHQEFEDEDESVVVAVASSRAPSKASLRKKSTAALSENFVCLNMKRKGYRRKGAGMTGAQIRRKQWKAKMAARSKSFGSNKCFKCGQEGHWASKCKGQSGSGQDWNPVDNNALAAEESGFPSLREAALMSRGIKVDGAQAKDCNNITDIEAEIIRDTWGDVAASTPAAVTFAARVKDVEGEMKRGLSLFGFSFFRQGQEDSVRRILQGLSTLVVLSTGGGKSLCYQLPAYLYAKHLGSLTLVVSPLVSLMEDQITGLPLGVLGACLHSGMTPAQREKVISSLKEGKVHFLLVSPEAIVERGGASQGSFPPPGKMPPIAFACIDEAHCLSEWSHNFRPSYLRLCKVLRNHYNVKCFLGLTATATKSTAEDVAKHLGINDPVEATIRGASVPDNLVLSVSKDENKDEALISLLNGERFKSCESILIYCSRRDHTERVATLIRSSMKTSVNLNESYQPVAKKRRTTKPFDPAVWTAESYHAGLTAAKRRTVQKAFMSGKLRVVVATVAFGMGLDKANVRAVVHYNIAKSFESYVQEIGRAGRDGQPAHCHVFLDAQNKDVCELQRHTFGNSVDRVTLKKFLAKVFKPCRCREIYKQTEEQRADQDGPQYTPNCPQSVTVCGGHERSMSIQETVQLLDMREEGIATLLSYLELHPEGWTQNLNHVYSNCSLKCYRGPQQLMAVAKKCPPVAVAIARQKMEGKQFADCSHLDFNVIDICDSMGWNSGTVKRELISLQWDSGSGVVRKTGVCVELSDLSFHYRSRGDLTANQIDRVLDFLSTRTRQQESAELGQLHLLSKALWSVSHKNYWMCSDEVDVGRSDKLKGMLRKYFDSEDIGLEGVFPHGALSDGLPEADSSTLAQLCGDIRQFVSLYGQDHTLTGRTIARVFHGIESPNFPAKTWGRVRRFWRAYLNVDFNLVMREATQILVALK